MSKQTKVNILAKKYADVLYHHLVSVSQSVYKIKYEVVSLAEIKDIVKRTFQIDVPCSDNKYQLTDWLTWQKLIEWDWTNHKKYIADFFDCNSFSDVFGARMREFYHLNSTGRFSCNIYDLTTKKVIPHRARIIIATDKTALKVYILETQSDKWVEVEVGKPIVIGTWQYNPPYYIEF